MAEISKNPPYVTKMIPIHLQWLWMATYTWSRHGGITLDQFKGIQGPSGWEIGQIWAKTAGNFRKMAEISKNPPYVTKMIPIHLQWVWMATYTWNRHGGIILDQFKGIQGPSGWEIGQIWAKIAGNYRKMATISKNPA